MLLAAVPPVGIVPSVTIEPTRLEFNPGSLLICADEISFLFLVGGFCWKLDYLCAILCLYRTMQRKGL